MAGEYNEVEGIFPDGEHTLVESSREQARHDSSHIDFWRLRLEPNSTDFVRMTRWGDYEGFKASNPVVAPDGKSFAFQSARSTDAAGVGIRHLHLHHAGGNKVSQPQFGGGAGGVPPCFGSPCFGLGASLRSGCSERCSFTPPMMVVTRSSATPSPPAGSPPLSCTKSASA